MAELVFTDCFLQVNGVDLSDHVKQVTLSYSAEPVDKTAMGLGTRTFMAGLKNWALEVTFNQDFAAAEVDATLFGLVGAAAHTVEVRPTSAARSATNPGYNGQAVLMEYPPLGGNVGDILEATARWQAAGNLSRSTA